MGANLPSVFRKQVEICLELVGSIERAAVETGRSADQQLAAFYRQHHEYGSRDRRFFSNAVFSWFRWRGWLKTPDAKNVAAAILLDSSALPPQAVILAGIAGLDAAILKPLGQLSLGDKAAALRDLLGTGVPDIGQLVPGWFAEMLYCPAPGAGAEHMARCIGAFQSRPPTWLRLRADREQEARKFLADMQIETGGHPFMEHAVFIKGAANRDLSRMHGAEPQDLASQCAGLCCSPRPGEQWWDVCAGAGGKTLHLADLMKDQGLILATDIRPSILDQLSKRLGKNRYHCVRVELLEEAGPPPAAGKFFDGVIVDAPCSGSGTWHRNPDARWRTGPGQVRHYAEVQDGLLEMAAARVKPGGRLVYATCSLTALENTARVGAFLERHGEFRHEPVFNPLTRQQTGGLIWIWPWEWNCNGMFIAAMKKSP